MQEFTVGVLTEKYAKEVCAWKYDGQYSVYNLSDWETIVKNKWDLADKGKRQSQFIAIFYEDEIMAYARIFLKEGKAFLGIGLKPSWCGKGYGKIIMDILVKEAKERHPGLSIALDVRSFNKRAIKCYEDVGFKIKEKCIRVTFTGYDEFYCMEYEK